MSIKAQTPREPTLPSRAPTTLLQAEAEGRHARPRPYLGERETRPGRPRACNLAASLAAVYLFRYLLYLHVRHLWQSRPQIQPISKYVTRLTLFLYLVLGTLQLLVPRS